MPKPQYILSGFLKHKLYWKLVDIVSFPIINSADCKKISDLISLKNLPPVSVSTLYRLFLSENTNYTPYLHTLDVLAIFCGYPSWFKLEKHFNELAHFEFSYGKLDYTNTKQKSLLKICIHRNELKPLYVFSEQFDTNLDFEKKLILGAEFYYSLKTNKNKNENFYKNFSQIPIIRESFYEYLADPTFDIKDYEVGFKYYLLGVKPGKSIQSMQDFIFGNSFLFRHYYITNKKAEAKKIAKLLYEENSFSETDLDKIYIFPRIRYYAYKLFYLYSTNQLIKAEKHEDWLIEYAEKNNEKLDLIERRILFYTLADAFSNNNFTIPEKQDSLKIIFKNLFDLLPPYISKFPLKSVMPYLDQNAAARWKY
jgi:hypothetical protein